jgi:hypothetical protein
LELHQELGLNPQLYVQLKSLLLVAAAAAVLAALAVVVVAVQLLHIILARLCPARNPIQLAVVVVVQAIPAVQYQRVEQVEHHHLALRQ